MVISDVIEREIKGLWGTDFADESNGIPVIKTNNMSYEGCIDYGEICYRNIDAESAKENYLHKGDLLVEKSGGTKTHTVGYVNHFDGDDDVFVCNNFILGLRPKKEMVNYMYLFYQLRYMYELGMFSDCYNKTTGIQNLQVKAYLGKSIVVPNMVEQNVVVKALDTIQKAIDLKRKQLEDLDELVKSKFQEMFGDVDTNDKGFETVLGKDVFVFSSGKFLSSEKRKEEGIPVYGGNGISWFTDEALIDYPTIIIGRVGAYCGNVKMVNTPVWITDNAIFIKSFKKQVFNIRFLCQLMENASFDKYADVVAQPKITQKPLENYKYIVPNIEFQEKFADYVKSVDIARKTVEDELVDLGELMDSKMDEYFG